MKILIISLFFPLLTNAYTWKFTSPPDECQNVSIAVEGSGRPPYSLLMVPSGPTPQEVNLLAIQNIPFPGNSSTLSFKLNYPANSSFVAVVSDRSGFGSGGTSAPVTVLRSSDSSCYNLSQATSVQHWSFAFDPSSAPTQCNSMRIYWAPSVVNGTVKFFGVIPGGKSFIFPQGTLTGNVTGENMGIEAGIGFSWITNIPGGTDVLFVASDGGGMGTGGSAKRTISDSDDTSCLDNSSPSSTAGSPAGGSYATSTGSTSPSNSGGTHSNTGAIVGAIVGGTVFFLCIALVVYTFLRRRLYSTILKERPLNVLQDDEDYFHQGRSHDYATEPFLYLNPTVGGSFETALKQEHSRLLSMSDANPLQTPVTTPTTPTRKGEVPQLRPSNIAQYNDAGPSGDPESCVTIELPPSYSNLRRTPRSPLATPTSTDKT